MLAIPSRAFEAVLQALSIPPTADVLSLTKGLDPATGRRLSQVAGEVLGDPSRVAVLSGPNHAEEIARGTPAATVVASQPIDLAARLQETIGTSRLRVYANADLVGVELCGAAKNVIGLAAGVSDGLGFGDNAKAALITRGLAEMTRLGASFDADPRTFAGLAGLGRPGRDVLLAALAQPPGGCAARRGRSGGRAGDAHRHGGGGHHDGARHCSAWPASAASSCRSRSASTRCCEGESPIEAVSRLMGREPV